MANVGIMGAGSWGTALALLLHRNGHQVTVWSISEEEVDMLSRKREHVSKLPGGYAVYYGCGEYGQGQGFYRPGGAVSIHQEHRAQYEPVCGGWTDHR